MEEYSHDQTQISGYNEAVLQIKRLNELWLRAEGHANKGNLQRWCWILDSIYRELYPDILKLKDSPKKIKEHDTYLKKIYKANNRQEMYFYLNKRHQLIKLIQDSCGKGAKYQDADDELPW